MTENCFVPSQPPQRKQDSNRRIFSAACIGSVAFETIHREKAGIIQGVTSRGIFVKTLSRWLVFISFEGYPSPLSINLPGAMQSDFPVHPGMQVGITPGGMIFTDTGPSIAVQNLGAWQPSPVTSAPLPVTDRRHRLVTASQIVIESSQPGGLSTLLPEMLSLPSSGDASPIVNLPRLQNILKLRNWPQETVPVAKLVEVLGTGPGLTPSGDDFMIGFLLAVTRWHTLFPGWDLEPFQQQIIRAAYQRTTTLSANLIECAAQGLADQRLINALDWLVSGAGPGEQIIQELLAWGSSSGEDVFVGFAFALML